MRTMRTVTPEAGTLKTKNISLTKKLSLSISKIAFLLLLVFISGNTTAKIQDSMYNDADTGMKQSTEKVVPAVNMDTCCLNNRDFRKSALLMPTYVNQSEQDLQEDMNIYHALYTEGKVMLPSRRVMTVADYGVNELFAMDAVREWTRKTFGAVKVCDIDVSRLFNIETVSRIQMPVAELSVRSDEEVDIDFLAENKLVQLPADEYAVISDAFVSRQADDIAAGRISLPCVNTIARSDFEISNNMNEMITVEGKQKINTRKLFARR